MDDMNLTVAIAQSNFTVGALKDNALKIVELAKQAYKQGADLMVTPEMALSGSPPEDLLLRPDFYQLADFELKRIVSGTAELPLTLVVGHPCASSGRYYNAASVIRGGKILVTYRKNCLQSNEIFDEDRYFSSGTQPCVFNLKGFYIGIVLSEDIWHGEPARLARAAGAQALIVLNASSFHSQKQPERYQVLRERISETHMPILYCNMVGAQDELVFDGASFACNSDGQLVYQSGWFEERLDLVSLVYDAWQSDILVLPATVEAQIYEALKVAVRDYVEKNHFPGVLVGLSGGIDSALTLTIAADALGAERVRAVMMPTRYTSQMSQDDARDLARRLRVTYDVVPIQTLVDNFSRTLAPFLAQTPALSEMDMVEENLQSRIRAVTLMALSNHSGHLVLTTGNKSEMAVGYATLYGDMAGGFAVLKDILKTFVYQLAEWRNSIDSVIPQSTIDRPPSAELRENQTDQDTLPAYEVLDAIIEGYMERNESVKKLVSRGYHGEDVKRVVHMLRRNEYKRRQGPVGARITRRGFGKNWRYPITSKYDSD